ncbi:helix-turn-helix transcriptional regulator [Nocardiopsis sp. ATB16-24]|uniref:helix-turn-helix domain-containing protein n=1 Tax=Nocardiopsis sp. ATB16-24 TaxID=3019555 RepID=UPI0025528926|nr:helix-turn-helix transcriptional regulator [Nocardiopsis sp. ATB16-24]
MKKKVKPHAKKWGTELKKYRTSASRTQAQVASRIQATGTLISGFESGTHWPSRDKVNLIDDFLGADGKLVELWVKLSNRESYPSFLSELVKAEPAATHIREFHPLVISGLLQTRAYARSLARASNRFAPPEAVEEIVEGRMRRQRIWDRPDPPRVHSIVNEAVLLAPTGGVEVMVEQLNKLIELVESHRLGLQIVPLKTGFHPGHTGMLVLMSFDGQPDALYLENALSGSMYHGPEVEEAHELFGELLGVAWSPEVSLERLRTIRKEFRDGTHQGMA